MAGTGGSVVGACVVKGVCGIAGEGGLTFVVTATDMVIGGVFPVVDWFSVIWAEGAVGGTSVICGWLGGASFCPASGAGVAGARPSSSSFLLSNALMNDLTSRTL